MARRDEYDDQNPTGDDDLFGGGDEAQDVFELGAPPTSTTEPPPMLEDPPGQVNPGGSTDTPRELFDNPPPRPPDVSRRGPEAMTEAPSPTHSTPDSTPESGSAPARSKTPVPVAGQPSAPFTPLAQVDPISLVQPRDPGALNVAMRAPSLSVPSPPTILSQEAAPVAMRAPSPYVSQPQQYTSGSEGGSRMFGRVGGLMGGGLGAPRAGNDFENEDSSVLDALIRTLLGG